MLQEVMPFMEVVEFASVNDLEEEEAEQFVHLFVHVSIFLRNRHFFEARQRKTIVLTTSSEQAQQLGGVHCVCVNVSEREFISQLMHVQQRGHSRGAHFPPVKSKPLLTKREVEVLTKVAQGFINKEIADQMNIGLTTVISHRKNITEKLGIKSVSGLTIYAVMNGYVDINSI